MNTPTTCRGIIILLFVFTTQFSTAGPTPKDSTYSVYVASRDEVTLTRTFPQWSVAAPVNAITDPILVTDVVDDSTAYHRNRAMALKEQVLAAQRFRDALDATTLLDLPIGIVSDRSDFNYAILLDKIILNPQGAFLEIYMSFEIPQLGRPLNFRGVCQISHEGGITGVSRLYLLGDHPFGEGNTQFIVKGDKNTFVEFDCNGFKGMSIEAALEFSKDLLIRENENGQPLNERVAFSFTTYITDWNDLLVQVTLPPFQIKGGNGLGFSVSEAYLDWSDVVNPPGLRFPQGYQSPFTQANLINNWTGVYIKRADVRLPAKLKESGSTVRTKIGVENLLLDDTGISGSFFGEQLIRAGDMSGWSYTLDRLTIQLVSNNFSEFSFTGGINIPFFEQQEKDSVAIESLRYTAFIAADGHYAFNAVFRENLPMNLLKAHVQLNAGSRLTIAETQTGFKAEAVLNGRLNIGAPVGNNGGLAMLKNIGFEGLTITTDKPYIRGGVFHFGAHQETNGNHLISGFPLTIYGLGFKSKEEEESVGFYADVAVNLVPASDEGFSGRTSFTVWGKQEGAVPANAETGTPATKGKWKFERVEIDALSVRMVKEGVFTLEGRVAFFEGDQIYGDGFKGSLSGRLGPVQAQAEAMFGKNTVTRYWYANALVCSSNGIPIAPGFSLYGFGGGAYYKMRPVDAAPAYRLGLTTSGVTYAPDERTLLGLKASVFFGSQNKPEPFNGDATFEISINRNGGINTISFTGNAYFMTQNFTCNPQAVMAMAQVASGAVPPANTARAQVMGQIRLLYDRPNETFHGNIAVYVNIANGILVGVGPNKRAGWAEIHFAPAEWYILIGTPTNPIGLELARLFKSQSYFMLGMNLPGSPPPHPKVSEILGGINLDYMRDAPALSGGRGFAFGSNFSVDTGDLRFLIFYGRFMAGAGFDIMLRDYGSQSYCAGMSPPLGVNGWYANGQAYAYVEGKIGIRVNLKFYKGDYDILKIGAAAVLQAKGPNPFWMKGVVGGYYSILGGLVKGNCRFEVTVGNDCDIVIQENLVENLTILAEVSPVANETGVNVFVSPQAAFNIAVEQVFEITDVSNVKRSFRVKLDEFSVKRASSVIPGVLTWNTNRDVVVFDSHDVLPGQSALTLRVKVSFEERKNGSWQKYLIDGKPVEELKEIQFTTGEAPDYIPASNVQASYPVHGQQNFYKAEYNTGFIELKRGQPDLFIPNTQWTQKGRFVTTRDGTQTEFDFTYNATTKKITFTFPNLPLATAYQFQLVNKPNQRAASIDQNVKSIEQDAQTAKELETKITTKDIEGKLDLGEDKVLYENPLRTSMYATFTDKVNAINAFYAYYLTIEPLYRPRIYSTLTMPETFDAVEINGTATQPPLVSFEAVLSNTAWYNTKIHPWIYEGYPFMSLALARDGAILGIPPAKNVIIEEVTVNNTVYRKMVYCLQEAVSADYVDIRNQLANYVSRLGYYPNDRSRQLIQGIPLSYDFGDYPVSLRYTVPGVGQTSAQTKNMIWRPAAR